MVEGGRLQVGVPGTGTGEGFPSLQGPPIEGEAMPTDMRKAAVLAACPPVLRDANPASLLRGDDTSMLPHRDESQGFHPRFLMASRIVTPGPPRSPPPRHSSWPRQTGRRA